LFTRPAGWKPAELPARCQRYSRERAGWNWNL